jgi:high-affinity iron transporter
MFRGIHRLDVSRFFKYTSILLVLFSAGLIATGVHALNEAGVIPAVVEHIWDLNTYPILQEGSPIGGGLKSLFGFDASPSLTEVLAYIGYWLVIGFFVYRTYRVTAASKAGGVKTYGS